MSSKIHLKQIRYLSLALFISGSFNIICIAFCFFWTLHDRPLTPYFEQKPLMQKGNLETLVISPSNSDLLRRYKAKSYEQLIPHLYNFELVEDGFTERDLALGVFVTFHDFDIERALGKPLPLSAQRVLSFDDGKEKVIIYPNLTKAQIELIYAFLKKEKWPFRSKGLFQLLKAEQFKYDTSLYDAFYLTSEFASIEALFKGYLVTKEEMIHMIAEGNFGLLSTFNEKQKALQDLSDDNRQKLLLSYINEGSASAALIFLKTDFDFAVKRLSDPAVLSILRLLNQNTRETLRFLNRISVSPRGDSIKSFAVKLLQEMTGKPWEPLVSRETIAAKPQVIEKVIAFPKKIETPNAPKITVKAPQAIKKSLLYIVQDGDSLWKIAKRFKVTVEEIRALNALKSDALKTGTPLKVPTPAL